MIGDSTEERKKKDRRFLLRSELFKIYGMPISNKEIIEEAYQWIWNSPLGEWDDMMQALKLSYQFRVDPDNIGLAERAKELYAFLSN